MIETSPLPDKQPFEYGSQYPTLPAEKQASPLPDKKPLGSEYPNLPSE